MTDPTSRARPDEEQDPTGVRALLSGLPDPGPMPADLVRRIEARLEVEQAHRTRSTHPLASHTDRLVDLAAERSTRRPGRTLTFLGAAAVGLAVTTVALTQVLGDGPSGSDSAAQYPSSSESQAGADSAEAEDFAAGADDAAAETFVADESQQDAGGIPDDDVLALPALEITVLADLGRVGPDDYAERIHQASDTDVTLDETNRGLTTDGAATCWTALGQDRAWDLRYAASASYRSADGGVDDVVVLLGMQATGGGRSWIVPADCVTDPSVAPLDPAGQLLDPR